MNEQQALKCSIVTSSLIVLPSKINNLNKLKYKLHFCTDVIPLRLRGGDAAHSARHLVTDQTAHGSSCARPLRRFRS